jgi:PPP family 3-phenylpropionic acid transporter
MLLMMASMKGMGYGLFYVSSVWFISNRVPEDWGSTVQALFSVSAFGIAPLLSSPIGGEIFDRFGPANIFLTDSLIIGVAVCTLSVAISRGVFVDAI